MKLTRAQRKLIKEDLLIATEIHQGVNWYIKFLDKNGKERARFIDGRVCNALERAGVLVPVPGSNQYTLNKELL
jgi:hypothetical protein